MKRHDTLKNIVNSIPFFVASYLYWYDKIDMIAYLLISGLGWVLIEEFWKWRDRVAKLGDYGAKYEPIFVLEYPGKWIDFPEAFQDNFIISAPGCVGEVVRRERMLLAKAGNVRGVEVIPILFQDGKYRTEDADKYRERCLWEMTEKLNAVNEHLQKMNPELYREVHHGERITNF